ncbi:hypothetical protein O5D80_002763 [Batrachochytrium dendrobatidis]|nr:hypothetical protein O5D80_002763 [Batrachochytrium dendrobatidis]
MIYRYTQSWLVKPPILSAYYSIQQPSLLVFYPTSTAFTAVSRLKLDKFLSGITVDTLENPIVCTKKFKNNAYTEISSHTKSVPINSTNTSNKLVPLPKLNKPQRPVLMRQRLLSATTLSTLEEASTAQLSSMQSQDYTHIIMSIRQNKYVDINQIPNRPRLQRSVPVLKALYSAGVKPDLKGWKLLMWLYNSIGSLADVKQTFKQMTEHNYRVYDLSVSGPLVRSYIAHRKDAEAMDAFQKLCRVDRSVSPYRMLIQAYIDRNDHKGVESALQLMIDAKYKLHAEVLLPLCEFYFKLQDYQQVLTHIQSCLANQSKVPLLRIYYIMMCTFNEMGDYQQVQSLIDKMKHRGEFVTDAMYMEQIVSFSRLGNSQSMWCVYNELQQRKCNFSTRSLQSLAQHIGPIQTRNTLVKHGLIQSIPSSIDIPILMNFLTGYAHIGDIASTIIIIDELRSLFVPITPSIHFQAVMAYCRSGDMDGALNLLTSIANSNNWMYIYAWTAILATAASHYPDSIDEIADRILHIYPHINIEHITERAQVYIKYMNRPEFARRVN